MPLNIHHWTTKPCVIQSTSFSTWLSGEIDFTRNIKSDNFTHAHLKWCKLHHAHKWDCVWRIDLLPQGSNRTWNWLEEARGLDPIFWQILKKRGQWSKSSWMLSQELEVKKNTNVVHNPFKTINYLAPLILLKHVSNSTLDVNTGWNELKLSTLIPHFSLLTLHQNGKSCASQIN